MSEAITSFSGEYQFLSNFWPCKVQYLGVTYSSVEHAFQAAKSNDPAVREVIRKAETAALAKKLGRKVALRKDWESIKKVTMLDLVAQKFKNDAQLKARLLLTGKAKLVEGNWWNDRFWGVCDGVGENHLGKLLMRVRDQLSK